jgi:hypothetical protein
MMKNIICIATAVGVVALIIIVFGLLRGSLGDVSSANQHINKPPTTSKGVASSSASSSGSEGSLNFRSVPAGNLIRVAEADARLLDQMSNKHLTSPDGKFRVSQTSTEETTKVSVFNTKTNVEVTSAPGSFTAWTPDSSKVLLYLSIGATGKERQMYYLDLLSGKYYDSGLPPGVIGASISPADGDIAYSLTNSKSDDSKIYVVNSKGQTQLLLGVPVPGGDVFVGLQWSPTGEKISFTESNSSLWVMNKDGSGLTRISGVDSPYRYPPIWSSDGSSITFLSGGNIVKYVI